MVLGVTLRRVMLSMNVAIQHAHRLVRGQDIHHFVAVFGEPFPFRLQAEEWPMREDDDRSGGRIAAEVLLEPDDLIGTDDWFATRNVVDGHEVNSAVIERVIRFPEVLTKQNAAVERRVVLTGDMQTLLHAQPIGDGPKCLEPLGVLAGIVAVVRQIAGEEDQIRLGIQGVDHVDGALERLCPQRIGRSLKADVRITELHDGERLRRLAVSMMKEAAQYAGVRGVSQGHKL